MSEPLILKLKEHILYENATGTGGDITLSKSANNYNMLKIYYQNVDGKKGIKEIEPNGSFILQIVDIGETQIYICAASFNVSGNKINVEWNRRASDWYAKDMQSNAIKITKVVGYK